MDFFQQQDVARRKTGLLVCYFSLAVVLMVLAVYAAVLVAFVLMSGEEGRGRIELWRPELLAAVMVGTGTIIALGSLYKVLQLRGGGESVAVSLGGRRVHPNTTDPAERRLLNVVEEMAIASGTSVPPVFVLDKEKSINAFAAGYLPGDAVIGVNRGTIDYLSRDELQGVIAHEFSHILHGDMRLNLRLIGLLHGILLLAIIGYYLLRFGGGSGRGKGVGQVVLFGLALLIIGYVGLFFARLIKAAVSRQREYLADSSAIQFTRNPDGLAGALKKIGGLALGSKMETPEAETASHMFFGSWRSSWFGPLSTHPPLKQRIRRIDPQFDGTFPRPKPVDKPAETPPPKREARGPLEAVRRPLEPLTLGGRLPLEPAVLLATVGAPTTDHVTFAQRVLQSMPDRVREAVHDAFSARAVVLAMLLDAGAGIAQRQLAAIRQRLGAATGEETQQLAPLIAQQEAAARLPLVEMVSSTLHELSAEQYRAFRDCVQEVVKADEKVSLFEFTLQQILLRRLDRHFSGEKPPRVLYRALTGVLPEIGALLSALVHLGHRDPQAAAHAFQQAWRAVAPDKQLPLRDRQDCSLKLIQDALGKLAESSPPIKKRVIQAATVAVATDGQVTVGEAELLRAIGDALECPVPPIFAGQLQPQQTAEAR